MRSVIYKQETQNQLNILNSNWYICPFCIICEIKPYGKLGCFWWETDCGMFSGLCKDVSEMELKLKQDKNWYPINKGK